jgi:hypothetical protein
MIRNLKALGLVVMAVLAMSAVAASAASAQQGVLTSDGPVILDGVEDGENFFEYNSTLGKVKCPGSTFVAEKVGGGFLKTGETTSTITPSYNNATCNAGGLKATVTMNGCDFVFHIGETTSGTTDEYGVKADLVCPSEKDVEVHAYASATNENITACKVTLKPQEGITGLDIGNELKEGTTETVVPHVLTVTGESTNIKASKSGLCGAGTTETAKYKANITLTGTNEAGGETEVTITHS